uniref:Cadherin domain-containing protein n=1 Tax=Panagrolaimus sp. JU765 TaxID=591449 RepID=A0AC34RJB8_9BILA
MNCLLINSTILFILTLFCQVPAVKAEIERHLQVSELAPIGHQIGYVSDKIPDAFDRANYYIVFPEPDSMAEKVLSVNEKSGEIILQNELDYEKESRLVILAIPINGSKTIKVVIDVEDYNDHTPTFPVTDINAKYARIDTEFALPSAIDLDSEKYGIKKYYISSGNVNNVFRLATSKLNSAIYVDLVVNGHLDREYRDRYDLVIEVIDGGDPPKKGKLNVHVKILDANDNAPEFLQSRYSVQIFSNVSADTKIVTVKARDADADENSRISYKFSENQFKPNEVNPFKINSETGEVTVVNTPLEPGTVYDLIVVATDHGVPQALESNVFLTVNVQNPNTGAARNDISLLWLTEDGSPKLSEGLPLGYVLARLSIRGHGSARLSLLGSESLCLKQTDSPSVYLVLVCGPLDREASPEIHLRFTLKNENDDILLDHPVIVELLDVNDCPPQWNQSEFRLIFNRHADFQQHAYRLVATDQDFGENARIVYSISGTDLFQIDSETGLITAKEELDCDIGNGITFEVAAADNGKPSLSSSVKVIVDVVDKNGKPPSFDKSLYEVTIREDTDVSTCIFQVSSLY